ncbi:WD repeat-containing protein wrap73 [Apophysomyces sp. BC1034]|nr:WD repeat-containing protein wrap73 [Apophysomyces sp. BC1034]
MNFNCYSDLYKHTSYQCKASPNCNYIANIVDSRLVIRSLSADLTILHVYACAHPINYVEWSPDSRFILTANFKRSLVEVWSVEDTHWKGVITDPSFGIATVRWSPDACSILCVDSYKVSITIPADEDLTVQIAAWMLADQKIKYARYPKFIDKGCESSPDGKYIAIVEDRNGKDYVAIYSGSTLMLLRHFATETVDLENIRWSPDGRFLAMWDNCLYYKLLVYRLDGELCMSYQAYEDGLGIKSVSWSPNGKLLAVGSYDQKVRIIKVSDWQPIAVLCHTSTLTKTDHENTAVLEEFSPPKLTTQITGAQCGCT